MREHLNGDSWPELAVAVDLPPVKPSYSPGELAQNYATLALSHATLWPRVVHALEYLRGHLIGAKGDAASARASAEAAREGNQRIEAEVRLLKEAVLGQAAARKLGLPDAMRSESPSSIIEAVSTKVSGEFEKVAKESQGPLVEATPDRLARIVREALATEAAARQARENEARLKAIDDAEKAAVTARKKLVTKVVAGFFVAFAAAGGAWAWGKAQGAVEAKATALEEARREVAAPANIAPATPARK